MSIRCRRGVVAGAAPTPCAVGCRGCRRARGARIRIPFTSPSRSRGLSATRPIAKSPSGCRRRLGVAGTHPMCDHVLWLDRVVGAAATARRDIGKAATARRDIGKLFRDLSPATRESGQRRANARPVNPWLLSNNADCTLGWVPAVGSARSYDIGTQPGYADSPATREGMVSDT
jgi:hypothetical protein